MICVYPPDCTDFSTNSDGALDPLTTLVSETLNSEYELQITHPIDDAGKWHRLVEGSIIRAPVPASMTPQVHLGNQKETTGRMIYEININSINPRLRSGTGTNYTILGSYKKGSKVYHRSQDRLPERRRDHLRHTVHRAAHHPGRRRRDI